MITDFSLALADLESFDFLLLMAFFFRKSERKGLEIGHHLTGKQTMAQPKKLNTKGLSYFTIVHST
jgi:hypothetical protein